MKNVLCIISVCMAALCGMSSCGCSSGAPAQSVSGEWYIGAYRDMRASAGGLVRVENRDYLAAFGEDSLFYAQTDCNSVHSMYAVQGDSLRFGVAACTLMACPEMVLEENMLHILPAVRTYERADTTLYLRDADGQVLLLLHRAEATPAERQN